MCTSTSTTPTFITEALHCVTSLQLFKMTVTLIGLVSTTHMDAYIMPTNDIDYSCHVKAIELIQPIALGPYHTTSRH